MAISDMIAGFIMDALSSQEGVAELQRSELAQKFNCVPSQINYVISTRFSPERGYIVESRRGGGGYIRIRRVQYDSKTLVMHTINALGDELYVNTAAAFISNLLESGVITKSAAKLLAAATSENALRPLPTELRNTARASVLKQMLLNLI